MARLVLLAEQMRSPTFPLAVLVLLLSACHEPIAGDDPPGQPSSAADAGMSTGTGDEGAIPYVHEYFTELVYPRHVLSSAVESETIAKDFLGATVTEKHVLVDVDLEVWGYSEKLIWSFVFNYDLRQIHILVAGKSQFIRDPIVHRLTEHILIGEPSNAPPDWDADWEVFISTEKPEKCSFHDPSSFHCFDWNSLGTF